MRVKALAATLMLILGVAGTAVADTHDPYATDGGGSTAPGAGSDATASEAPEPDTDASGGAEYGATTGAQSSSPTRPVVPGYKAKLLRNGLAAAPAMAPAPVQKAVWAANEIVGKPYVYGGGHNTTFKSRGYDCSGTISYALHFGSAKFLRSPLDSGLSLIHI